MVREKETRKGKLSDILGFKTSFQVFMYPELDILDRKRNDGLIQLVNFFFFMSYFCVLKTVDLMIDADPDAWHLSVK